MCGSKFVCVFITYLAFVPSIFCDNPFVDLIIDGTQAKTKEFPAMVSIQFKYRNYHICGGSLIGWNHILTAAHCVVWKNEITGTYTTLDPLVFQIMAGDIRIDDGSFSRQIRYASQLIPHPAFDPQIIENDVAVIRVYPRFTETPYVNLITLDKSTPKPNRLCVISGWGTTKENVLNSSPHVLRKTEVEIKSMHFCNSDSSYGEILPKFTICAGSIGSENLNAKNKEDSCQGDSGGPLMCGHRLTGIVSFGRGCGEVRYPGIYTDVSKFRSWIEDVCNHAIVKRCSGINLIIQWVILYKM